MTDRSVTVPTVQATLRLLATTDLHAHICGWDYHNDQPRPETGLSALATLIADARADCPDTLLLDNGDFLQGSPLGDWAAGPGLAHPHPVIAAMNALGYDAATLGNHEFGHGLPFLERALSQAAFPVVSANLRPTGDSPVIPRGVLLTRTVTGSDGKGHSLRIGITGIAPPQTAIWEGRRIAGRIECLDPLRAATEAVAALRRDGADVVVLLAHSGAGAESDGEGAENPGHALARHAGADAMFLGHTHAPFPPAPDQPALLHGIPAVGAGAFGSHLACIDLDLSRKDQGWRIAAHRARLLPAKPTPAPHPAPHPTLAAACGPAHRAARAWLDAPVGTTAVPLRSHFALLAPCDILRLVAAAQAAHARSLLPDDMLDGRPVLSAAAPFRAVPQRAADGPTDIDPGPLRLRHAADLYPHPNTLTVLATTGAELACWLERAVILFNRLAPDRPDMPLLRDDVPGFDFDLIDGLSFAIDLSAAPRFDTRGRLADPAARRITDLRHKGRPVVPTDRFVLVTNSYRAAGSGGFPACRPDRILAESATPTRQILIDHIAVGGAAAPLTGFDWRFLPPSGPPRSATVTLAASALPHLADIAHLHPEPLGPRDPDCQRFRLRL